MIKNATNSSHIQLTFQTQKRGENPQTNLVSLTGGSISNKSEDLKTSLTQTYSMLLTPSYTSHLKTDEKKNLHSVLKEFA